MERSLPTILQAKVWATYTYGQLEKWSDTFIQICPHSNETMLLEPLREVFELPVDAPQARHELPNGTENVCDDIMPNLLNDRLFYLACFSFECIDPRNGC